MNNLTGSIERGSSDEIAVDLERYHKVILLDWESDGALSIEFPIVVTWICWPDIAMSLTFVTDSDDEMVSSVDDGFGKMTVSDCSMFSIEVVVHIAALSLDQI